MPLPYLTRDFPGTGGTIRNRPEDFFVQELPLYEPSGEGEHVYCEVQKVGLTTFQAIDRLSSALRVPQHEIGYAGLKDARAITRQIFSIRGVTEAEVMDAVVPDLSIQWVVRHGNKLRLGHLAGNRFAIKIRDVNPTDVVRLRPVIATLEKRGMPNYFGEQRFGQRANNHLLGAALVRGDDREVLRLLLGSPDPAVDDAETVAARAAFDAGDLEKALRLYPRRHRLEGRILARLMKTGNPAAAVRAVDERIRRLWISALQSEVFNRVAGHRIESIDRLMDGDLAWKHANGACFLVESAAQEQPRCDAFEISPSGPLPGYRMSLPQGEPLRIEQEAFALCSLTPGEFRVEGRLKVKGARRPLRVRAEEVDLAAGVDEHGGHITVAFTLPAGSFATVFLRELMKNPEGALTAAEDISPAGPESDHSPETP